MNIKERVMILAIVIGMFAAMGYVQYAHAGYIVNCYYNSSTGLIECHKAGDVNEDNDNG